MKAMTLLLVLVAYGDSPDYLPAAAAPNAPAASQRRSAFGADTDNSQDRTRTRNFDPSGGTNQGYSKQRGVLPKPLGATQSVRQVRGATGAGTNRVRSDQFDTRRQDRSIRPVDFDVQSALGDAKTADFPQSFSLSAPGQSANENDSHPSGARNNASGNRYIPANANVQSGGLTDSSPSFPARSNSLDSVTPDDDRAGGLNLDAAATKTRTDAWAANPRNASLPTVARRQTPAAATSGTAAGAVDVPPPAVSATSSGVRQAYTPPTQRDLYGSGSKPGGLAGTSQHTTTNPPWQRLAENTKDPVGAPAATAADAARQVVPMGTNAAYPAVSPSANANNAQRYVDATRVTYPQPARPAGSFMTTMLALFGSIGLNLYLGWVAWDTYNRYQDLVHDVRYTGSRRDSGREVEAAY